MNRSIASVYLSSYLSIYLSVYLSIYLSIYLSVYLSIYIHTLQMYCIIYVAYFVGEHLV